MRTICTAVALVSLLASLALPAAAEAQTRGFTGVGLGPAVRIDDAPTQVRFEGAIGASFDDEMGFFIAFAPSASVGDDSWILVFPARFGFLFEIFDNGDVTLGLGPTGTAGFALAGFAPFNDALGYFHFSFAAQARLIVESLPIAFYVRPFEFEFAFGGNNVFDEWIRYVAAAGIEYFF
jgi:hypothetical protein